MATLRQLLIARAVIMVFLICNTLSVVLLVSIGDDPMPMVIISCVIYLALTIVLVMLMIRIRQEALKGVVTLIGVPQPTVFLRGPAPLPVGLVHTWTPTASPAGSPAGAVQPADDAPPPYAAWTTGTPVQSVQPVKSADDQTPPTYNQVLPNPAPSAPPTYDRSAGHSCQDGSGRPVRRTQLSRW